MKPGADFQQAGHATFDPDSAFSRFRDSTQNLKKGRFARAISPNDANQVPLLDVKRYLFECPEAFLRSRMSVRTVWTWRQVSTQHLGLLRAPLPLQPLNRR